MRERSAKVALPAVLTTLVVVLAMPVAFAQTATVRKSDQEEKQSQAGSTPTPTIKGVTTQTSTPETLIKYVPPNRGAPAPFLRVSGSTRGSAGETLGLDFLAPDNHVGLTRQAQPTLYFYLSEGTSAPVGVTIGEKGKDPYLDVKLPAPLGPGIQAIDLSHHNVRLDAGKRYRVIISVGHGSNSYAIGAVERTADHDSVRKANVVQEPLARARVLAAHGLWYDAIHELSSAIDESLPTQSLYMARQTLLEQVGLAHVAAHSVHVR